jgi:hypothetical protein
VPVNSTNDTEAAELRSSQWASYGVRYGLAADAAARLATDPSGSLPPRFVRALAAIRDQFSDVERFAAEGTARILLERSELRAEPDRLIAQLALRDDDDDDEATKLRAVLAGLSKDLNILLESPTSDAAARLAPFLEALSEAASHFAQLDTGDPLEAELATRSFHAA